MRGSGRAAASTAISMSLAFGAGPRLTKSRTRRTSTKTSVRTTMTDSLPHAVSLAHRCDAEMAPFTPYRGHIRAGWLAFLRSLAARGLSGVRLIISDAHRGLWHRQGNRLSDGREPVTSDAIPPNMCGSTLMNNPAPVEDPGGRGGPHGRRL
jgi:Transposase, Mutator family